MAVQKTSSPPASSGHFGFWITRSRGSPDFGSAVSADGGTAYPKKARPSSRARISFCLLLKDDLPADDGRHHLTTQDVAGQGRVLAFGAKVLGIDAPFPIGINDGDVGWGADGERAGRQREDGSGSVGKGSNGLFQL